MSGLWLRTGLPGHGKSLLAVWEIEKWRQESGRPVYVNGIDGLKLPWHQVDDSVIERWWEIEPGAIIVVDEAQRFFRPRGTSGSPPEKITRFELHRKTGHDVVLITQHPSFLDVHIRKLVEWHIHCFRGFGLQETTRYQWQECQNPNDRRVRKECQMQKTLRFPKEAFEWYHSANVHNVERQIPWRRIGLVLLLLVVMITSFTFFVRSWMPEKSSSPSAAKSSTGESLAAAAARTLAPGVHDRVMSAQELAVALTPVIPAIPASAPLYQPKWLEVADVPVISGCVASSDECVCYTQQGTRVDVDVSFCRSMITRPVFDHTRARQVAPGSGAVVSQAPGSTQGVVPTPTPTPTPTPGGTLPVGRDVRRERERVVLPAPRGA